MEGISVQFSTPTFVLRARGSGRGRGAKLFGIVLRSLSNSAHLHMHKWGVKTCSPFSKSEIKLNRHLNR